MSMRDPRSGRGVCRALRGSWRLRNIAWSRSSRARDFASSTLTDLSLPGRKVSSRFRLHRTFGTWWVLGTCSMKGPVSALCVAGVVLGAPRENLVLLRYQKRPLDLRGGSPSPQLEGMTHN